MTTDSMIVGPGLDMPAPSPRGTSVRSLEDATKPITPAQLADLLSGGFKAAGKPVTPRTSLRVSTVMACVRIIAFSIARMPLITYERTAGGRVRAENHPLYRLLKNRPHPYTSSFSFRSALMTNTLLWGNGYAEIIRRGDGRPEALGIIEPERVTPFLDRGQLKYRVFMPSGEPVILLPRDILHVPGLSFDGVCGLSVIAHARMTIGAALAADEFSANFLGKGLRPSGVLQHPKVLTDPAYKNLRESFEAIYGGAENAGKPMILEEGMVWQQASMPLNDAQFVENAGFRVEEICRWYGVPPHKVQHLARSTNNNIEQQGLDFLGDTLGPWLENLEEEINYKLFGLEDQDRYYAEHLTQKIVQLDTAARVALYKGLRDTGAINPDEIRERENMNNLPDERGTVHLVPSNMMPAPTPEQADQLVEAWIKKGLGAKPSATGEAGGEPAPTADDKVAQAG